jgi:hypothetical protein
LLVPDELGEELLLEPVPELELPMPLLLGDVELLPDVLGDELLGELLLGELLLDVPPLEELELLPDLLKWASHSCREIEPSPFLSTDENVGVELLELLAPPEALGEDDEEDELGEAALGEDEELLGEDEELLLGEDELLEAPPEALPEDLLSVALGLEELLLPVLPVLCAAATPASAKSAAAVAVTTTFNFIWIPPRRVGERRTAAGSDAIPMPAQGTGTRIPSHAAHRRRASKANGRGLRRARRQPERNRTSALGQREPVRDHSSRADEKTDGRERLDGVDLLVPPLVVSPADEGPQHGEGVDRRAEREQCTDRHDERTAGVGAAPEQHAGQQEHQPDDQPRDQNPVRDHARLLAHNSGSEPEFVFTRV